MQWRSVLAGLLAGIMVLYSTGCGFVESEQREYGINAEGSDAKTLTDQWMTTAVQGEGWQSFLEGASSRIERRLNRIGISDVKVLIIGDTVILGKDREATLFNRDRIKRLIGERVHVLTVYDSSALEAMDRVKQALSSPDSAYQNIASDLALILNSASNKS